ncbi:transcriptional regulator (plasmid) [Sphingobium sp. SCG-1]|uniref:helix-turn-helix domain-containing protein n=1 Tax=Sphingobium sp. SCG-1 TaxID=2072936 RepID=UPI000CD6ADDB|nr:helix-turn-helix domain-containing protein [Sphingobium sp. SCG-1]AUW60593.1 transcriptional regulator [Sphingobium sp. SCG-1]
MITSAQMRAARAMLGLDQRALAELAGLSLPTVQRMEASGGQVRGIIDTLMKVIQALEDAGVELIGENSPSMGSGRGVRLREAASRPGERLNGRPAREGARLESANHAA